MINASAMLTDVLHGYIIPLCIDIGDYEFLYYMRKTSHDMEIIIKQYLCNHFSEQIIRKSVSTTGLNGCIIKLYYTRDLYEYILLMWCNAYFQESGGIFRIKYFYPNRQFRRMVKNSCRILHAGPMEDARIIRSNAYPKIILYYLRHREARWIVKKIISYVVNMDAGYLYFDKDDEYVDICINNMVTLLKYMSSQGTDIRILPPAFTKIEFLGR